jgi:hypothetical protein
MTVARWKKAYKWEERALAVEQSRAMVPYSREAQVNDIMGTLAVQASEIVTRAGMADYEAMIAAWRQQMMAEDLGAREFKDLISAYDTIDQIGRRIARLPTQFKQTVSSYGQGGTPMVGASDDEDKISWT